MNCVKNQIKNDLFYIHGFFLQGTSRNLRQKKAFADAYPDFIIVQQSAAQIEIPSQNVIVQHPAAQIPWTHILATCIQRFEPKFG